MVISKILGNERAFLEYEILTQDLVFFESIFVPEGHRNFGHGSQLLDEFLEICDEEGWSVLLAVQPTGPMNREALITWYMSRGFVLKDGDVMERIHG